MNYAIACEIHRQLESTGYELRFDFYRAVTRYAALRTEWHFASPDERREMDTHPHFRRRAEGLV